MCVYFIFTFILCNADNSGMDEENGTTWNGSAAKTTWKERWHRLFFGYCRRSSERSVEANEGNAFQTQTSMAFAVLIRYCFSKLVAADYSQLNRTVLGTRVSLLSLLLMTHSIYVAASPTSAPAFSC